MGNQPSAPAHAVVVGTPVPTAAPAPATAPASAAPTTPPTPQKLDLVFTFDCTGSMGSYIQSAKQNMELIARRLSDAEGYDLRFGLVAYRDHPPQDQTFVTKSFPFTDSVALMQASLRTLSAQGGGDGPEAVAAALHSTLHMDWRPDATKVVILIADAPPHGLGESGDGFPDGGPDGVDPLVVLDQMSTSGICIYSVGCQPALSSYKYAVDFFVAAATRTNGQAVSLGSAASLADVILGGCVEEMDLEKLAQEMAADVQQLRSHAPDLDDEACQQQVFSAWQAKGNKTRQMRHAPLTSENAGLVSSAASLSHAKMSLAAAPPRPTAPKKTKGAPAFPCASGGGGGAPPPPPPGRGMMRKKAAARSSSPTSPILERSEMMMDSVEDSVTLEEDVVSFAQVERLYGRCKKKGIF